MESTNKYDVSMKRAPLLSQVGKYWFGRPTPSDEMWPPFSLQVNTSADCASLCTIKKKQGDALRPEMKPNALAPMNKRPHQGCCEMAQQ